MRSTPGSPTAATGRWRSFVKTDEPPEDLDDLLADGARVAASARARLARRPCGQAGARADVLFVHAGVNPQVELEAFLAVPWNTPLAKLDEDRHWAWVRWPFLEHRPGPEGFSGFFVVHGHTPNDARRDASHADQIAGFRLNLDAGSAMTGVAKMAIIRGRHAEVVSRARADQPGAHGREDLAARSMPLS